jgi:hypothetical protein
VWSAAIVFVLTTGLGLLTADNRFLYGPIDYHVKAKHTAIEGELKNQPGEQLVLVRYGPRHELYEELVYNHADIDGSRIVWARSLGGAKDAELIRHYPNRQIWLVKENAGVNLKAWDMEIAGKGSESQFIPQREESTMTHHLQRRVTGQFQVRSKGLP